MKVLGLLTLVAAITRTFNSHMNTQMESLHIFHAPLLVGYSTQFTQNKKKNLIAVFFPAAACLSLWVSGALGTGYDRPQLEYMKFTP